MAKLQWRPLQTGGNFVQGNSAVFNFTDNLDLQDNHTVKIAVPNLTSLSQQIALSYADGVSFNRRVWFKDTNGNWVQEYSTTRYEVSDIKGTIIVIVPKHESSGDHYSVYLCKDEAEKLTIPNYGAIPAIETRVVSSVTAANFDSWRRGVNSAESLIPLVVSRVYTPYNDQTKTYADTIAAIKSGDKIRITDSGINNTYNFDPDLPLVVVGQTTTTGSTIIYDLDERVTLLETQMAEVNTSITELSSKVSELQEKVTGVLSATSKFYVSR